MLQNSKQNQRVNDPNVPPLLRLLTAASDMRIKIFGVLKCFFTHHYGEGFLQTDFSPRRKVTYADPSTKTTKIMWTDIMGRGSEGG